MWSTLTYINACDLNVVLYGVKFFCVIFLFTSYKKIIQQASGDAKKLVDEERSFAKAEIENARAAVQRVEEALQEHERMSRASGKQVQLKFFCLHLWT